MNEENICGCGKPTRYMVSGGSFSCNKYSRCPSYDELRKSLSDTNLKLWGLLGAIRGEDVVKYACDVGLDQTYSEALVSIKELKTAYDALKLLTK